MTVLLETNRDPTPQKISRKLVDPLPPSSKMKNVALFTSLPPSVKITVSLCASKILSGASRIRTTSGPRP